MCTLLQSLLSVMIAITAIAVAIRISRKRPEEKTVETWAIINGEFVEYTPEEMEWRASK